MPTIKGKIIISSVLVFGATLAIFAFLVYKSLKQAELVKLDARLEAHAEKLETEIEEQSDDGVFPLLEDLNDVRTEGLPEVLVQVWDASGNIVVRDSILSRLSQSRWRPNRLSTTVTENLRDRHTGYRCQWHPVEVDERTPLVLEIATSLTAVHESLEHLRVLFMITIPLALLFVGVAAYVITRLAFRPLTNMAVVAQGIDESNLDQRLVLPAAKDEIRSLAETLNRMIGRIEAAFRSQRQFVADASHEIRTPLTIIYSELEYAQKSDSNEVIQDSIKISLSEIDRLSRMVDGLLLLARVDSSEHNLRKETFRLDELVVEIVQLVQRLADSKKTALDLYIQEAAELTADRDMVKRAIMNVLENAIKYSPSGVPVSIRLRTRLGDGDSLYLDIEDRGPGIPEDEQQRIFERFYRTPEARAESAGSGLGLAIAKRLLELNGGKILLCSKIGAGTTMTIEFPGTRTM